MKWRILSCVVLLSFVVPAWAQSDDAPSPRQGCSAVKGDRGAQHDSCPTGGRGAPPAPLAKKKHGGHKSAAK
jgi:hypothetical protein